MERAAGDARGGGTRQPEMRQVVHVDEREAVGTCRELEKGEATVRRDLSSRVQPGIHIPLRPCVAQSKAEVSGTHHVDAAPDPSLLTVPVRSQAIAGDPVRGGSEI